MRKLLTIQTAGLLIALTMQTSCTQTNSNATGNTNAANTNATASSSPATSPAESVPAAFTLPILNALFADEAFKSELKSKVQLTDDQINALQKSASDEVARLHQSNAEDETGNAAEARELAANTVRKEIGDQKAAAVFALVSERWKQGGVETSATGAPESAMLPGPNAVPKDSRIVVNIPAYRMDLFHDGTLVKSYKVGIGYPQFPLPTGLRKAQQIIFNPTWTPPDEPWVAGMKNIKAGEKVEAGSELNPLGPIKIPIGQPSLIHGGKSPAKIGTFASHGCVGLTNAQVKDFARRLAEASGSTVSAKAMEAYLKDKTKTRVVKLEKTIPVELRYETIVLEDGKLYIYKDVYDQNSNTEENLRKVLDTNGVQFDSLSEDIRAQLLESLNAMSAHPKKIAPTPVKTANANANTNANANAKDAKADAKKPKTPASKKERVIELAELAGKGYPAPVDLDNGSGKPAPVKTAATSR
jgi:lipoprotein-anchoring transpeptidase ErfK/SrfK